MSTAGQSPPNCRRRLIGRSALVDPPTRQSPCQDGLLKLTAPKMPVIRGAQTVWSSGLSGWPLMYGAVRLTK